jgi:hypothetical protein
VHGVPLVDIVSLFTQQMSKGLACSFIRLEATSEKLEGEFTIVKFNEVHTIVLSVVGLLLYHFL